MLLLFSVDKISNLNKGGKIMNNKNLIKSLVIASIILMVPIISNAKEGVTGKIVGYKSLFYQGIDPIDNQDPLIDLEDNFVLLMDNAVHYFLRNIPRSLKVKYYKNQVEVVGRIDKYYRYIDVDTMRIINNGESKIVWDSNRRLTKKDNQYGGH